jgi:periplasmic protein TonB
VKRLAVAGLLAALLHAGLLVIQLENRFPGPGLAPSRQVLIDLVEPVPLQEPSPPRRERVPENKPRPQLQPKNSPPPLRTATAPQAESPPVVTPAPAPAVPADDSVGFSRPTPASVFRTRGEGRTTEGPSTVPAKPGKITDLSEAVPLYRENPPPAYPALARKRGYEGTVILEVFVNRRGRVEDQKIHQSSGHAVLDEAALTTVKDWQFTPGKKGETPIDMWVRVPICFNLKN